MSAFHDQLTASPTTVNVAYGHKYVFAHDLELCAKRHSVSSDAVICTLMWARWIVLNRCLTAVLRARAISKLVLLTERPVATADRRSESVTRIQANARGHAARLTSKSVLEEERLGACRTVHAFLLAHASRAAVDSPAVKQSRRRSRTHRKSKSPQGDESKSVDHEPSASTHSPVQECSRQTSEHAKPLLATPLPVQLPKPNIRPATGDRTNKPQTQGSSCSPTPRPSPNAVLAKPISSLLARPIGELMTVPPPRPRAEVSPPPQHSDATTNHRRATNEGHRMEKCTEQPRHMPTSQVDSDNDFICKPSSAPPARQPLQEQSSGNFPDDTSSKSASPNKRRDHRRGPRRGGAKNKQQK